MNNVLLFKSNYFESDTRDERVEFFGRSLNDVFLQFEKLWNDHKELLEKSKQSEYKLQNVTETTEAKCCACSAAEKGSVIPAKESVLIAEEKKINCEAIIVETNDAVESLAPEDDQSFQMFAEDFCTQSSEEGFDNQQQKPLPEIQNITPKTVKSPVFKSKKVKSRIASLSASTQSLSEESVVMINDFPNETNSKHGNRSISNFSDSSVITTTINTVPSPIRLSSQAFDAGIIRTPKNVRKLGISTTHNVNTEIILGSKKKLKQSKLYITTEKVTDLGICDNICVNKSDDNNQVTVKPCDSINTNYTKTNNSCLDDSLIQVSPTQDKGVSRIRQKMAQRNKSAEILNPKFNTEKETLTDIKQVVMTENTDGNIGQTDTDITIFEPKLASTQYGSLSADSTALQTKKPSYKNKLDTGGRIDPENKRIKDYESNDATLFDENVIPSRTWLRKEPNFEKSLRRKRLSLKKSSSASRNLERILSDHLKINDKEMPELEIDRTVDRSNSKELDSDSPPRRKLARDDFHVPRKKKNTSPTYVYKGSPVRKHAERRLLNGWSCFECQKYYEAIGLDEEELRKRKNICSRHRSKYNHQKVSQGDYWNPDFASSFQSTIWNDD